MRWRWITHFVNGFILFHFFFLLFCYSFTFIKTEYAKHFIGTKLFSHQNIFRLRSKDINYKLKWNGFSTAFIQMQKERFHFNNFKYFLCKTVQSSENICFTSLFDLNVQLLKNGFSDHRIDILVCWWNPITSWNELYLIAENHNIICSDDFVCASAMNDIHRFI